MSRGLIAFPAAVILVYGLICAALYFGQRAILYHPTPESQPPGADELLLPSDGETLKIWMRPLNGPRALIYFGGNAEDVGYEFADFAQAFPQHAIYLVNFRGYGGSTGTPTEQALFTDAENVFAYVQQTHPDISVIGRSLGSGVAAHLASVKPVQKLALVTPFDSILNIARERYSLFPVSVLLRDKFDSVSKVPQIKAPTLIIVGESDIDIPPQRSDALAAAFKPEQVTVQAIPGGHNDLAQEFYLGAVASFLGS